MPCWGTCAHSLLLARAWRSHRNARLPPGWLGCRPGDVIGAGIHLTKHEIFFT